MATDHREYVVPFDGSFRLGDAPSAPPEGAAPKKELKERLKAAVERIAERQRALYADDRFALLLIFQAIDAGGKDSTIRAVLSGVNPTGCQVYSFKQPSAEELDHDFLWRTSRRLPERGRIGVFNRSYYEEVLVVRVHPEHLAKQKLPAPPEPDELDAFFARRLRAIRDHERHVHESGTRVLKFWLNVSREEQKERFLARIDRPEKNWKFSHSDIAERAHWDAYMRAYEVALNETSREHAPWFAIPADSKSYMRARVAEIIAAELERLPLRYPELSPKEKRRLDEARRALVSGEA